MDPTEPTYAPTPKPTPTVSPTHSPTAGSTYILPGSGDYPPKPKGTYIQDLSDQTDYSTTCNQGEDGDDECEFHLYIKEHYGLSINGKKFNVTGTRSFLSQIQHFSLGSYHNNDEAHEFTINNGRISHVYHQHINPFQVQHKVGLKGYIALDTTWWDNLGNYGNVQSITSRMWTRGYWNSTYGKISQDFFGTGGGLIIVHCHLLQHEDSGMMGYYGIRTFFLESDTDTDDTESASDSSSDEVVVYVFVGITVPIIICLLIVVAVHYFRGKEGLTKDEKNLAETHRAGDAEDVVHSGSIDSAVAGSTEMTTTVS